MATIILVGWATFAEYYASTLIVNDTEILKQVRIKYWDATIMQYLYIYNYVIKKLINKKATLSKPSKP